MRNSMSWSRDQAYAFIDETPRIGRLATTSADGTPHAVPVWAKRDGDRFLVHTLGESTKARNIRENGRFALTFDKDEIPYMGATLFGTAEVVSNDVVDSIALVTELAIRFVGPEGGSAYGEYVASIPGEHVTLVLTVTSHESWDHSA
jgi:PPOX class probable F420-dependent enzyme